MIEHDESIKQKSVQNDVCLRLIKSKNQTLKDFVIKQIKLTKRLRNNLMTKESSFISNNRKKKEEIISKGGKICAFNQVLEFLKQHNL